MPGPLSDDSEQVWPQMILNIFMFLKFSQEFWSTARDVTTVIKICYWLTNEIKKE